MPKRTHMRTSLLGMDGRGRGGGGIEGNYEEIVVLEKIKQSEKGALISKQRNKDRWGRGGEE